jgi:hypothetical protein
MGAPTPEESRRLPARLAAPASVQGEGMSAAIRYFHVAHEDFEKFNEQLNRALG